MKLFIWDFHGTLEQDNEFAVKEICETLTDKQIHIDKVRELYGKPWGDYFREMNPNLKGEEAEKLIESTRKIGIPIYQKHTKAAENAIKVLEEIKKHGDVNIVLSNTRDDVLPGFLEVIKVTHLIDDCVGIPKDSEVNGHDTQEYKAKQMIKLAKEKNYDEVIAIGDSEADILAGKKAKATTFMIDRWNRHPTTSADYRITDLKEVLRVYS